jgi:DNA repair protein RecO (recombination protein O)
MKVVEKGIVIQRSSYSETSLLVTILTEMHGISTFLFQGGKKRHGNLLAPMAAVEFSYYRRNDSTLLKMTEARLLGKHSSVYFDPVKSGIAFFMAELIYRLIKPGHTEKKLFDAMLHEIEWLDHSDVLANYPVWILAEITRHLGITPSVDHRNPDVFDMLGGRLTTVLPNHPTYLQGSWVHWLESAIEDDKNQFLSMQIPRNERLLMLDAWMDYFKCHLSGVREIKSLEIMREVLTD